MTAEEQGRCRYTNRLCVREVQQDARLPVVVYWPAALLPAPNPTTDTTTTVSMYPGTARSTCPIALPLGNWTVVEVLVDTFTSAAQLNLSSLLLPENSSVWFALERGGVCLTGPQAPFQSSLLLYTSTAPATATLNPTPSPGNSTATVTYDTPSSVIGISIASAIGLSAGIGLILLFFAVFFVLKRRGWWSGSELRDMRKLHSDSVVGIGPDGSPVLREQHDRGVNGPTLLHEQQGTVSEDTSSVLCKPHSGVGSNNLSPVLREHHSGVHDITVLREQHTLGVKESYQHSIIDVDSTAPVQFTQLPLARQVRIQHSPHPVPHSVQIHTATPLTSPIASTAATSFSESSVPVSTSGIERKLALSNSTAQLLGDTFKKALRDPAEGWDRKLSEDSNDGAGGLTLTTLERRLRKKASSRS